MPKKRTHKQTSKEGEEFIKPHKPNLYEKILEGMKNIPCGGNFEEQAAAAGLKPSQVWKRNSELESSGYIFNTNTTCPLSSGVSGIVWQLTGKEFVGIDRTNKPVEVIPDIPVKKVKLSTIQQQPRQLSLL